MLENTIKTIQPLLNYLKMRYFVRTDNSRSYYYENGKNPISTKFKILENNLIEIRLTKKIDDNYQFVKITHNENYYEKFLEFYEKELIGYHRQNKINYLLNENKNKN